MKIYAAGNISTLQTFPLIQYNFQLKRHTVLNLLNIIYFYFPVLSAIAAINRYVDTGNTAGTFKALCVETACIETLDEKNADRYQNALENVKAGKHGVGFTSFICTALAWEYIVTILTHNLLNFSNVKWNTSPSIFMPPFEEEGVYCFANVGQSVGRPDDFR